MEGLKARHKALLRYVLENPGATAKSIALHFEEHPEEPLQATDNATRCALRRLCQKGYLGFTSTKMNRQHPTYFVTELGRSVV